MSQFFRISIVHQDENEVTLQLAFGEEATNEQIVPAAVQAFKDLRLIGGPLVKFDGPASLPVAMALAHAVAHLFGAVAVKDPKLGKFVVAISHDPQRRIGELIS